MTGEVATAFNYHKDPFKGPYSPDHDPAILIPAVFYDAFADASFERVHDDPHFWYNNMPFPQKEAYIRKKVRDAARVRAINAGQSPHENPEKRVAGIIQTTVQYYTPDGVNIFMSAEAHGKGFEQTHNAIVHDLAILDVPLEQRGEEIIYEAKPSSGLLKKT